MWNICSSVSLTQANFLLVFCLRSMKTDSQWRGFIDIQVNKLLFWSGSHSLPTFTKNNANDLTTIKTGRGEEFFCPVPLVFISEYMDHFWWTVFEINQQSRQAGEPTSSLLIKMSIRGLFSYFDLMKLFVLFTLQGNFFLKCISAKWRINSICPVKVWWQTEHSVLGSKTCLDSSFIRLTD